MKSKTSHGEKSFSGISNKSSIILIFLKIVSEDNHRHRRNLQS